MHSPSRLSPKEEARLVLALLLLPLLNAAIIFLGTLTGIGLTRSGFFNPFDTAVSFALTGGLASVLVIVLVLIPSLLLMIRTGRRTSLARLVVSSLFIGNVPTVLGTLLATRTRPTQSAFPLIATIAIGSALGLMSAFALWHVGVRGTSLDQSKCSATTQNDF